MRYDYCRKGDRCRYAHTWTELASAHAPGWVYAYDGTGVDPYDEADGEPPPEPFPSGEPQPEPPVAEQDAQPAAWLDGEAEPSAHLSPPVAIAAVAVGPVDASENEPRRASEEEERLLTQTLEWGPPPPPSLIVVMGELPADQENLEAMD